MKMLAALLTLLSLEVGACKDLPAPSGIAFPTYHREGNDDSGVLISGRLVERDRCLYLEIAQLGGRRSYSLLIGPTTTIWSLTHKAPLWLTTLARSWHGSMTM